MMLYLVSFTPLLKSLNSDRRFELVATFMVSRGFEADVLRDLKVRLR